MSEMPENGGAARRWRRPVGCGLALAVGAGVLMLLTWAIQAAQESAHQTQCRNNMKQLLLGFHNYHDTYDSLPFASICEVDGTPIRSWRVTLTPYLDASRFYNEYNHDEPWNSPHNRAKADRYRYPVLRCPSCLHSEERLATNYVVVCGPGTAFPDGRTTSLADFQDGPENTILVVEIDQADIYWSKPHDLHIDEMSFDLNDASRPSVSSAHPSGVAVGFADGAVYRLDPSIRPETLRALLTIAGGEDVKRDDLILGDKESSRVLGEPTQGE